MIKGLAEKFGSTLYIQIWENRIKLTDTDTGQSFDEKPLIALKRDKKNGKIIFAIGNDCEQLKADPDVEVMNPFSHPRQLLGDFVLAEKILQHAIRVVIGKKFISLTPAIVVHPMEKTEGGLSAIENRGFRELALSAGAREVKVYIGPELSARGLQFRKVIEPALDSAPFNSGASQGLSRFVPVVIWIAVIGVIVVLQGL